MKKHPPTKSHNHLARGAELAIAHKLDLSEVLHCSARHDEWCDYMKSPFKFCNCDARVMLTTTRGEIGSLGDGLVVPAPAHCK